MANVVPEYPVWVAWQDPGVTYMDDLYQKILNQNHSTVRDTVLRELAESNASRTYVTSTELHNNRIPILQVLDLLHTNQVVRTIVL
jgi:hypothetical protein